MPSTSTLFARELRRNPTDAERLLWHRLRRRQLCGYKFRRQVPIGSYTVDFVCLERNLVVELDGSQHAEPRASYDRTRDDYLDRCGFRVLRFWNNELGRDIDNVIEAIWSALEVPESETREAPLLRPFGAPPPASRLLDSHISKRGLVIKDLESDHSVTTSRPLLGSIPKIAGLFGRRCKVPLRCVNTTAASRGED